MLSIYVDVRFNNDPTPAEAFGLAKEVVSQLIQVRCLEVRAGFARQDCPFTWPFIRDSILRLPMITHLSLYAGSADMNVKDILQFIDVPWIRKLTVHGLSERGLSIEELEEAIDLGQTVRLSRFTLFLRDSYIVSSFATVVLHHPLHLAE